MSLKRRLISSSSSQEKIGYNEDILTEISLYLPVKAILRFRSVSNQWHSLLSHPQFIRRYASHKSTNSFLFIKFLHGFESLHLKGSGNHNLNMVDFGYIKKSREGCFSLKNSCNGLLLFESHNYRVRRQHQKRHRYYVCNPSTRKNIELQALDSHNYCVRRQHQKRHRYYVCNPSTRKYIKLQVPDSIASIPNPHAYLAFDPSKSPHYKVIFFWTDEYFPFGYSSDYHINIAIYSSETRTCRNLNHTFRTRGILYTGMFLNEAIFWVCRPTASSSLCYFDINQETMKEVLRPPYSSPGDRVKYIGDCRGRLHLIFHENDVSQHVFEVYELKEDYSSWLVKYKVDLDDIAVDFPELIVDTDENSEKEYEIPIFIRIIEEDEEDPTIVLSLRKKLVAYNLIAKTTRKIKTLPPAAEWYKTFHCIESLSLV